MTGAVERQLSRAEQSLGANKDRSSAAYVNQHGASAKVAKDVDGGEGGEGNP